MTNALTTTVVLVALALALWTAVLELLVVVLLVFGIVVMGHSDRDFSRPTFVGYLVALILIPPGTAVWAVGERTRYGTGVLLVGFLVVPVMILRLQQIWAGPGA